MKRVAALGSLLTLATALMACGTTEPEPSVETQAQSTTPPPPESSTEEIFFGEPFTLTRCEDDQPCDVDVIFTDITLTETCPGGVSSPEADPRDAQDNIYVTIEGEYTANLSPTNFSISETDFTGLAEDGTEIAPAEALDCNNGDDAEQLSEPVSEGSSRKGQLTMSIDPRVITLQFAPTREPVIREISLKDIEVEPGSDEVPGQASSESPAAAENPVSSPSESLPEEPTIVECLSGTPGPTLMSDGTVQPTDYCFYAKGGPESAEAESRAGYAPLPPADSDSACAAAICGYGTNSQGQPNPTSGEIQTLDGCQRGYITDPELCAAVEWVETHQY